MNPNNVNYHNSLTQLLEKVGKMEVEKTHSSSNNSEKTPTKTSKIATKQPLPIFVNSSTRPIESDDEDSDDDSVIESSKKRKFTESDSPFKINLDTPAPLKRSRTVCSTMDTNVHINQFTELRPKLEQALNSGYDVFKANLLTQTKEIVEEGIRRETIKYNDEILAAKKEISIIRNELLKMERSQKVEILSQQLQEEKEKREKGEKETNILRNENLALNAEKSELVKIKNNLADQVHQLTEEIGQRKKEVIEYKERMDKIMKLVGN